MNIGRCDRRERAQLAGARPTGQAGLSLIESVVAVAIVSLVVLALLAALTTILFATNANRRTVRSGIEVTTLAESVRRLTYVNCETDVAMENRLLLGSTPVYSPPSGYTVDVESVSYLNSASASTPTFGGSCGTDRGVQRVVLRATATGGPSVTEEIVVHKRRDTCPASIGPVAGERC
jgi:hypothetical protein